MIDYSEVHSGNSEFPEWSLKSYLCTSIRKELENEMRGQLKDLIGRMNHHMNLF